MKILFVSWKRVAQSEIAPIYSIVHTYLYVCMSFNSIRLSRIRSKVRVFLRRFIRSQSVSVSFEVSFEVLARTWIYSVSIQQ